MKNKIIVLLSVFILCMTLGLKDAMAAQNVITVAKSGGDFTSIQAAIDSINPTADNPYLINVMPGTYVENVTMKSYIHLQGAGKDATTIQYGSSPAISCYRFTNVTISGLTVEGGISNIEGSSITITDNIITQGSEGIFNHDSYGMITISGNIIIGNQIGLMISSTDPSLKISENIISGNNIGISIHTVSLPVIVGNTITGNTQYDIALYDSSSLISASISLIRSLMAGMQKDNIMSSLTAVPHRYGKNYYGDGCTTIPIIYFLIDFIFLRA